MARDGSNFTLRLGVYKYPRGLTTVTRSVTLRQLE
jgi:hypothetical protein